MKPNPNTGKADNHFEDDIADLQKKLSEYDDNDWSWLEGLPRGPEKHTPIPFPFERVRGDDFGKWSEPSVKIQE